MSTTPSNAPRTYASVVSGAPPGVSPHIVCVRDAAERAIVRPHFPDEFQYYIIEVSDSPFENLIPHFSGAKEFTDAALKANGRVLVHCNDGISRAPSFAIAYVMESVQLNYKAAFEFVQQRRYCVNPNEGFKLQLKEYEPIFSARAQLGNAIPDHDRSGQKRPAPVDDDSMRLNDNELA